MIYFVLAIMRLTETADSLKDTYTTIRPGILPGLKRRGLVSSRASLVTELKFYAKGQGRTNRTPLRRGVSNRINTA